MNLPVSENLMDAISKGSDMNRKEGKVSTVALIHPKLAAKWYDELGVEMPLHDPNFDPAPTVGLHRIIEDESVDENEVCCLSDEDYMEHERLKRAAGDI